MYVLSNGKITRDRRRWVLKVWFHDSEELVPAGGAGAVSTGGRVKWHHRTRLLHGQEEELL